MNSTVANFLPASRTRLPHRRFPRNIHHHKFNRNGLSINRVSTINAKQGENDNGKSIDENMIALRMRIKNMKVFESSSNEVAKLSSDWLEWEKRVFARYHENVFDSVEMLQSCLMNTRPSVALGILMLVAMSVPFSTSVVMVNALKVAKGLLAGCHVCIDIDF